MWAHLILVFNFYHLTNENIEITYIIMICFLQRVNMSKNSFKYQYTERIHLNIYILKEFILNINILKEFI